ncbi:MAG: phosphoribosyltransferase, partial [Nanoarchaeota archaeon]|nr:phosphoribosyltransferase [Nanoarchaeota archaeon]
MKTLTLKQIITKIKLLNLKGSKGLEKSKTFQSKVKFDKFDLIVAIGKDGIMPASLLRHFLDLPVYTIWINYRNKENTPIRKSPILTKPLNENLKRLKNKNILLVDTVSRTGKTLKKAKDILKGNKIKTFVINGKADYSLYRFKECINWP